MVWFYGSERSAGALRNLGVARALPRHIDHHRSADMTAASITEHMEVLGSDGHHVGKVDHFDDQEIELAKLDLGSGLKHHIIPRSWVASVDEKVHLRVTKDEAKAAWREKS